METIYVEHETDTAHRLSCHTGKCRNLHGHRYRFIIGFKVEGTIEDTGFQDFYDLKSEVRSKLDKIFDHATVLKDCEENHKLISLLNEEHAKLLVTKMEPTVEYFVLMLRGLFAKAVSITIYETPTNYCKWEAKK